MSRYSIEREIRVWDEENGTYVAVGNDGDGLGIVEIRQVEADRKVVARISMEYGQAVLLCAALSEFLSHPPGSETS